MNKFNFIKKNSYIVDLGSSPGGWSQVAANKIIKGKILSIDIKPMEELDNVNFVKGDFLDKEIHSKISSFFDRKIDVLLSDMAANTTGNKNLDSVVTGELTLEALRFAKNELKQNGFFVSKIFMGSTFNEIVSEAKSTFKETSIFKPHSSRKESKESFIICKKLR